MKAQISRISLADYTPAKLRAMRSQLEAQRRQEIELAKGIDRILNRVAARLEWHESRRLAA